MAHGPRLQSITVGRAWRLVLEAPCHMASQPGSGDGRWCSAPFLLATQSVTLAHGRVT